MYTTNKEVFPYFKKHGRENIGIALGKYSFGSNIANLDK